LTTELSARVRIALRGPDGAQLLRPKATLGEGYRRYRMNFDGVHLVADNVTIGKHRVNLQMAKWHAPPLEFELVAGQDLLLTLDVAPAVLWRFHFTMPLPDQWQSCEFTLRDVAGEVIAQNTATANGV